MLLSALLVAVETAVVVGVLESSVGCVSAGCATDPSLLASQSSQLACAF